MKRSKLPAVSLWPASRKPELDQMIGAPPNFFRDATHTDHYHIIAYSLECQVLQLLRLQP